MTCLTQLLWLSHALVLDRYRSSISPANWMALVSSGHPDIETMMKTLGDKFIDDLTNNCNDTWVYAKQQELNACLKALTEDVVFVVDEIQFTQGLFEEPEVPHKVKFVNSINERTTFLSALVRYSLPAQRTVIVTGTQMTNLAGVGKSGESKPANDIDLTDSQLEFPRVTAEKAIEIVSTYFPDLKRAPALQQLIGKVAQGRLQRITALLNIMCSSDIDSTVKDFDDLVKTSVDKLHKGINNYVHTRLQELHTQFEKNPAKMEKWNNLLKQLYINTVISSQHCISETTCKELEVNLEDLGFALATKREQKLSIELDGKNYIQYFSICEPLSFEIFQLWMASTFAWFIPFVTKFERDLASAVDPSFSPSVNAKGNTFESLIGALFLNLSKTPVKINQLPIITSVDMKLPDWTDATAFPSPWTFYGDVTNCMELSDAAALLAKVNLRSCTATLKKQIQGSPVLGQLFKNEETARAELKALQAIKATDAQYAPELLMLLTRYDKALVKPSKYFGPDLIGFKGDVLYSVGVYCYSSPETKEDFRAVAIQQSKQKTKFTANYQKNSQTKTPFPKLAHTAFEAVKLATKWKEVRFDIRMPQTNGDVSHVMDNGQALHIIISQENFKEITLNKESWFEIAAQLGYKSIINEYLNDDQNKLQKIMKF